jgi:membrane protein involved in colicin uptake
LDVSSISNVPNLQKLLLRNNPLDSCDSFTEHLGNVSYLDLQSTQLAKKDQLQGCKFLLKLQTLMLQETPLNEEIGDDLKKEFLVMHTDLKQMKLVNEEEVAAEDLEDALNEKNERIKAEEEARKEAEEEAKRQAEEAANAEKEDE